MNTISPTEPDWSRENVRSFWDVGRKLLRSIRRYQYWSLKSGLIAGILSKYYVLTYHFWSTVSGAEIPLNCHIGGGLLIPHPNGIVIHPDVSIGPNCLIFQQVTIGSHGKGTPTIGGHVDIGAGAKIIGLLTIGDHGRVGANAVVISNVKPGETAVGIPAISASR